MLKLSEVTKVPIDEQVLSWFDKVGPIAESGWAKNHVFCSDGTVAGMGCKTLACASEVLV
jgi:hypothetical protein